MKRKTNQDLNRGHQSNNVHSCNQSEPNFKNTVVLIEDQDNNKRYNNGDIFGKFRLISHTCVIISIELNNLYNAFAENKFPDNVPRRLTHSSETKKLIPKFTDHDDNKYERRTMTEKFGRFQV